MLWQLVAWSTEQAGVASQTAAAASRVVASEKHNAAAMLLLTVGPSRYSLITMVVAVVLVRLVEVRLV
jgi:hypothetical protein